MTALRFAGTLAAFCALARAFNQHPQSLRFEPKVGQTGPAVTFLSRGQVHAVLLTAAGCSFRTGAVASRMEFIGANPSAEAVGLEPLEARSNYLIGAPQNWRIGVQVYGRVEYRNIYPGVGIDYYGDDQQLQYDLVLHPGADASQVRIRFQGAE